MEEKSVENKSVSKKDKTVVPLESVLEFGEGQVRNGLVKPTIENLERMLRFYKIKCRYNVISKYIEIIIPGKDASVDNRADVCMTHIANLMTKHNMSVDRFRNNLLAIADKHRWNPVYNWVTSIPWDGVERVSELCETIEVEKDERDAKNIIIERWLYQTMALAVFEEVDAAGILVLQGPQNLGKTWWIKKLGPSDLVRTGAALVPKDRDSVSQVIQYWIVELGELDGTFAAADVSALKAFLTRPTDILRRPYGYGDCIYPRRTAFAASVNPMIFLQDNTGNRRFWTIGCKKINSYHNIDMQQLWAEIYHYLVDVKKDWRITKQEVSMINESNKRYEQIDPIRELIIATYGWEYSRLREARTCTEIARDIGVPRIDQRATRAIAKIVRDMGCEEERTSDSLKFKVPPRRL